MLALRLDDGFPKDWLNTDKRRILAKQFVDHGLLMIHPEKPAQLRLTARGFALSDQVIQALA